VRRRTRPSINIVRTWTPRTVATDHPGKSLSRGAGSRSCAPSPQVAVKETGVPAVVHVQHTANHVKHLASISVADNHGPERLRKDKST